MAESWLQFNDTSFADDSEAIAIQCALLDDCQEHYGMQHLEDEDYAQSLQEKYDAEFAAALQSTISQSVGLNPENRPPNYGFLPSVSVPLRRMLTNTDSSDESNDESFSSHHMDSQLDTFSENDRSGSSNYDGDYRSREHLPFGNASDVDYEALLTMSDALGEVDSGLNLDEINQLPCRRQDPSSKSAPQDKHETNCLICLSERQTDDRIRTLPCFHEFHQQCIDKWLKTKRSCPVCRLEVQV